MLGDVSCEVFKYRILFPNNFSNSKHQIRHFISLFVRREHENIYLHSYFPEQISYDVLKPDQLEFMKPMRSNRDYEVNLLERNIEKRVTNEHKKEKIRIDETSASP